MFWRIVLLIIFTLVLPNSHSYPIEYDEDLETNYIDSGTSLIDTEDFDNLETSTIDSVGATIQKYHRPEISTLTPVVTTVKDDDPIITTIIPQISQQNQNKTVVFRTLMYDGPLIVEKIDYVKVGKIIPIFFRLFINNDSNKDDSLIIKPSSQLEDFTTTESNSNVF